jgi:hypothetical protein
MEKLADGLQIWQSALGVLGAGGAFLISKSVGRQLAEDVVLAFATGAVIAPGIPLVDALVRLIDGA